MQNANKFIVGSNGFLQEINCQFDKTTGEKTYSFSWTYSLRKAKKLTRKQAKEFVEKHKLDVWVWCPFAEEPIRDAWTVGKKRTNCDDLTYWTAKKVMMESESDAKYLAEQNSFLKKEKHLTYSEAVIAAHNLNVCFIKELAANTPEVSGRIGNAKICLDGKDIEFNSTYTFHLAFNEDDFECNVIDVMVKSVSGVISDEETAEKLGEELLGSDKIDWRAVVKQDLERNSNA